MKIEYSLASVDLQVINDNGNITRYYRSPKLLVAALHLVKNGLLSERANYIFDLPSRQS